MTHTKNSLKFTLYNIVVILTLLILSTSALAVDFRISNVKLYNEVLWQQYPQNQLKEGGYLLATYDVKNVGESGDMKIELLVQRRKTINSWFRESELPFAIFPATNIVPNCVVGDPKVQTEFFYLNKNQESTNRPLKVKLPIIADGEENEWGIFIHTFKNCAKTGLPIGETSWDAIPITITQGKSFVGGPEQPRPTCSDQNQNQDETALDCGGKICGKCSIHNLCDNHEDCSTGYCGRREGENLYRCLNQPEVVNPDIKLTCGNNKGDKGEDCASCPQDLPNCNDSDPEIPKTCGNGKFDALETCKNCLVDLSKVEPPVCPGLPIEPPIRGPGGFDAIIPFLPYIIGIVGLFLIFRKRLKL